MLAGEKPTIPTPPKVDWSEDPKLDELPVLPVPLEPVVPVVPVVVDVPGLMLELDEPLGLKIELPPNPEPEPIDEPPRPPLPLGPTPATTEPAAEPAPAMGWPKNPNVCVFVEP